jgi:hypothetical protein
MHYAIDSDYSLLMTDDLHLHEEDVGECLDHGNTSQDF